MKKCITGLIVLFVFSACGSGSKVTISDSTDKGLPVENSQLIDEDFDPNSLQEPVSAVSPKSKKQIKSHDFDLSSATPNASTNEQTLGYRIQILQTQDAEQARTVQNDAIVELDAEVYSIFDSPYYKVRVGDFAIRADAEELLQKVIRKGYKSAWVVRTKINRTDLDGLLREE
ncbi:MAG: SPOR domain-containing protein [Calditrichaeota bacterium]|nr:MAG: SPOR domain-containing protein [Calditrichota bacterium]